MKQRRTQLTVWTLILLILIVMPSANVIARDELLLQENTIASTFCIPTSGTVTQRFHSGHKAIDIAGPSQTPGNPVYATYAGQVVYRGRMNMDHTLDVAIAINHGMIGGVYVLTIYHHMGHGSQSYVEVNVGDLVQKGDLVGHQGDGGVATGVHLHFAVYEMNRPFLNEYTHWGNGACQRTDLWYELGGGGGCGTNPNAATPINPESGTYLGSLPSNVTQNCFVPDNTPPSTSHSLSGTVGDSNWYRSSVQVTLMSSDNSGGSGVNFTQYKISDGTWQTYAAPFTISSEGRHIVYYKSQDNAGNWESQKQVTINIDTDDPNTPTINPGCNAIDSQWQNTCNAPDFSWLATDPNGSSASGVEKYAYIWSQSATGNPSNWSTYTRYNPPPVAAAGEWAQYYLHVKAKDRAGNLSPIGTFGLWYDGSAPVANITEIVETVHTSDVQLDLDAQDSGSGLQSVHLSNDGVVWETRDYSPLITWRLPAQDRTLHTVQVQLEDRTGNRSEIYSRRFCLDLHPTDPPEFKCLHTVYLPLVLRNSTGTPGPEQPTPTPSPTATPLLVSSAQVRIRFSGRTTTNPDVGGHNVLVRVIIREPMSGQILYEGIDLLPVSGTTPETDYGTITLSALAGSNIYIGQQYDILITGKMHLTRRWSVTFPAAQSMLDLTSENEHLWAGDFNDDNRIDDVDHQIFQDEYIKDRNGTITPEMFYKIDLNGDGKISIADHTVFVHSYNDGPGVGDE